MQSTTSTRSVVRPRQHGFTERRQQPVNETQVLILGEDKTPLHIMRMVNAENGTMEIEYAAGQGYNEPTFRYRERGA